jgi:hypothetical protein
VGLDIPASRALARRLAHADFAARSAWLVFPARYRLRQLALGEWVVAGRRQPPDVSLQPYFETGRLHQAALAEVYSGLQEAREQRDAARRVALLAMDALALPLAPMTSGASLALAGAVHAVVRAAEMGQDIDAHLLQRDLAALSYSTVQACILEHPSQLALAAKLLQGGFDIAADLAPGKLGATLSSLQMVLAIGHGAQAVSEWALADAPMD